MVSAVRVTTPAQTSHHVIPFPGKGERLLYILQIIAHF